MKVWVQSFLIMWVALLGREGLSSSADVTVKFHIPLEFERAWIAQKKGNITFYSIKENTNQFTKAKKPFVEGHITEIQMTGLESATFIIPESGRYRLKWNVDGMPKWTQDFEYNGVDNPEPFTILYNAEGAAVTVYEAKNKGTETTTYTATAAHGEHQDVRLRSMVDAKTKAAEERARQEALLETERKERERRLAIEEEARKKEEERVAKERSDAAIKIQSKARQAAAIKRVDRMKKEKTAAEVETARLAAEAAHQRAAQARLEEERAKKAAEEEAERQAEEALQRAAQARLEEERAKKAADEELVRKAEAARQKAEEEARDAAHKAAVAAAAAGREVNPEAVDITVNIENFNLLGAQPTFIFKKYNADSRIGEEILRKGIRMSETNFKGPDRACELSLIIGADQFVLGVYAPGLPLNYIVTSLGGGEVYVMPK